MRELSRRGFLAGTGAVAAGCLSRGVRAEGTPWNVLFICSDEHNPKLTGYAGHGVVRTPNLDGLAAQGLRCTRTYVASPICAPTRQSWLTGLFPQEHGQVANQFLFDPRNPTLVERFRSLGYSTTCLGKLHTNVVESDGRFGFDLIVNHNDKERWRQLAALYEDPEAKPPYYDPEDDALIQSIPGKAGQGFRSRVRPDIGTVNDYVLVEQAKVAMASWAERGPQLLYVSLRFPHYPFDLPEAFYYRHDPASLPTPPGPVADRSGTPGAAHSANRKDWDEMNEAQRRVLQARYYGAVEFTDHLVGELLRALEESGQASRTLVVYTTDHGDMAGEKGLWLKTVMFDAAARKPFLIRMPGELDAGREFEGLISEVDILPTLLGLLGHGAQVPADISGRDLSEALRRRKAKLAREHLVAYDQVDEQGHPRVSMLRTAQHKLVIYEDPKRFPEAPDELYDMQADPEETHNLGQDPALADLRAALRVKLAEDAAGLRKPSFPILPKEAAAEGGWHDED
ncbi:MAG: sulfatase-like hydrolase/transferase [Alphaproteobacteria bacterium]|nr:sulfatase-like hydrolase/transferase [Alphaproteobacteria bacterium]MCB9792031.1 sulfatase-like hydrolase/transferase [Alphaproteobacteria bacterium]